MYTYDITVSLLYLYYIYLFKFTLFYCPYTLPFPSQNRKLETIVYKSNSASAWLYTTVDSADRSRFPRCEIHGSRRIVIYENRTTRIVSSKPVMETNIKIKMKKEKKKMVEEFRGIRENSPLPYLRVLSASIIIMEEMVKGTE